MKSKTQRPVDKSFDFSKPVFWLLGAFIVTILSACQKPALDPSIEGNSLVKLQSLANGQKIDEKSNEILKAYKNIMVAIQYRQFKCNGFLIAPFKIVTVAHCFFDNNLSTRLNQLDAVSPNMVAISYNAFNLNNSSKITGPAIKSVKFHPEFRAHTEEFIRNSTLSPEQKRFMYKNRHDIALIEINQEEAHRQGAHSFFNQLPSGFEHLPENFDPIKEQEKKQYLYLAVTSFSWTTGHHQKESLSFDEADLLGMPTGKDLARFPYPELSEEIIHSYLPSSSSQTAICYGDSGSPLFLYNSETKTNMIVGLASFALFNGTERCGNNIYFMYLPFYYNWLGLKN